MTDVSFTEQEKLMVKLSYVAYCGLLENSDIVKQSIEKALKLVAPTQSLVWGPAVWQGIAAEALIYIVQDKIKTNEYTVVVRGTNPFSLISWISEDLTVDYKVPWKESAQYSAAKDAKITASTAVALGIHKALGYPHGINSQTFLEFLKGKVVSGGPITVNFTGHSLGGLMSSTLALWFYDMLGAPELILYRNLTGINVFAFAGPTAGDNNFASYSDGVLAVPPSAPLTNGKYCTRYANYYDIVVHTWNTADLNEIFTLYSPIQMGDTLTGILNKIILSVDGLGYTQLKNMKPIYSDVVFTNIENLPDGVLFMLEAAYQHVFPYLLDIVDNLIEELSVFWEIIISLINVSTLDARAKDELIKYTNRLKDNL